MKKYCVYKHTSPSGKEYIGYTKQGIEKRWVQHIKYAENNKNKLTLSNAILKYSANNWEHKVLFETDNKVIALEKEKYYIEKFDTFKNGYNSTTGGEGGYNYSEEARKKMSKAKKGKMLGKDNPFFGKKHSKETIAKMIKSREGYKHSEETKEKISKGNFGKTHSKNSKEKMKNSWTEERRKKFSKLKKGNKSNKGNIWINNGAIRKMIFKENTIPEGFTKGWFIKNDFL